ncbi:MAG: hypothetical protein CMH57_01275 [Myxococcales bacterium]|nr:hypothetical protein [Myxococcales bacterium]
MWGCSDDSSGGSDTGAGTSNGAATSNGSGTTGGATSGGTTGGATGGTTGGTSGGTTSGPCSAGETRCLDDATVEICEGGEFVTSESCLPPQVCSTGLCVTPQACDPGEVVGCWDDGAQRVCNAEGSVFEARPCAEGLNCLDGACTDMVCRPGAQYCADLDTLQVCNEDGSGYTDPQACPDGSVCVEGTCLSGCELSKKQPSYIGCQYWSLDLDNYPDPFGDPASVPHAVVVSNPSDQEATVNITTMADITLDPSSFTVPPGDVAVYTFPRLDVDGTGITNHSFYLESSWPVVAYQFNPLNNEGVFSNDASLLLPAESLGTEYIVLSWPTTPIPEALGLPPQHGYFTIAATSPGTTDVTVTLSANVGSGSNVPFMEAGTTHEFTLRQFQVLNLEADGSNLFPINDLSGSIIRASKPIAVFGGHEEAVVGDGCCAEHLEQQLFPTSIWGVRYLAAQAEPRGGASDVWRVVAAVDNTQVETIPPQPGAASFTLNRGEWIEIDSGESFEIVSDLPIMVGQYLKSQEATPNVTGDPAFILAVPIEQFRDEYTVLTPEGYTSNWMTLVRRADTPVLLDGQMVSDAFFVSFGSGDWEYAWVPVEEGPHTVESASPFSLSAYGYSGAVSYGYPGGLNLRVADEE